MTIYLYVKTHNKTGLKYLGKTTNPDPHSYIGSGKYWRNHLKKHGRDFTTKILRVCYTNQEVKEWGVYYSQLWDVVKSNEWANLTEESGTGGKTIENFKHSKETKSRISAVHKGRKKSQEHIEKMRQNATGKSWGRHSEETKKKLRSQRHSEEFKQRLSEDRKGSKNPMYGKTTSDEAKAKIREGVKKAWERRREKERAEALSD